MWSLRFDIRECFYDERNHQRILFLMKIFVDKNRLKQNSLSKTSERWQISWSRIIILLRNFTQALKYTYLTYKNMWIIFALTSAIILASRKIQEKKLVWSIGGVMWWMIRVWSVITAFVIWLSFSRSFDGISSSTLWWVLLYCFFAYPLLIFLYYKAMHHLPFSLFGMLAPIVPVTALLGTWWIYGTVPSFWWFFGIASITIAVIVLMWKHEDKEIALSSLVYAALSYMIMWFGGVLDKVAMEHVTSDLYALLNQMVALISLFLFSFFLFDGPKLGFYRKNIRLLSWIGATQWLGYVLVMTAISIAPNPWYVVALSNTHAIIITLYGTLILWEKFTQRKMYVFLFMILALISFAFA